MRRIIRFKTCLTFQDLFGPLWPAAVGGRSWALGDDYPINRVRRDAGRAAGLRTPVACVRPCEASQPRPKKRADLKLVMNPSQSNQVGGNTDFKSQVKVSLSFKSTSHFPFVRWVKMQISSSFPRRPVIWTEVTSFVRCSSCRLPLEWLSKCYVVRWKPEEYWAENRHTWCVSSKSQDRRLKS